MSIAREIRETNAQADARNAAVEYTVAFFPHRKQQRIFITGARIMSQRETGDLKREHKDQARKRTATS